MSGDPARRPSNERIRVQTALDAVVWVECAACLGDGWNYPGPPRPKSRKYTCEVCEGRGANQRLALHCGPNSKIVSAPKGACREVR